MTKISICVPAYNGEKEIPELIESLLPQIQPGVAIIFSDDKSTDNTYNLLKEYEKKYAFIKVFQNEKNLGMDGNFAQSVLYAKSEYVWLCGQDDIFNPGAIDKFFEIARKYPEVNFVYFNYRFLNGDLTKEVSKPAISNLNEDRFFLESDEYFNKLDQAPSFLPAIIMKRQFWDQVDYQYFFGTHYVQVGVWLSCFNKGNVYVVADPKFIVCRVPEDSWKNTSGQMLFEIFSGTFEVYKKIYEGENNCLPREVYEKIKNNYSQHFLTATFNEKILGFKPNDLLIKRMKYLFNNRPLFYLLVVLPIFYTPKGMAGIVIFSTQKMRVLKKLIYWFLRFK
ncbi:MAG: glycosyltransferase family 2 protein [Candidatus Margulisiibacteriota bacterium]|jgi:glycosyltransferase involved in cell wall biosynthesis